MSSSPIGSIVADHRSRDDDELHWTPVTDDAAAWLKPLSDHKNMSIEALKAREQHNRVDQVRDMVPFWINSMKAAEKGEIMKLEDFLESLHTEASANDWAYRPAIAAWDDLVPAGDGWGYTAENLGWGDPSPTSGWSVSGPKKGKNRKSKRRREEKQRGGESKNMDPHSLVDSIAKQRAMDDDGKQKMHSFFDMPTNDQVKKIDEVITALRSIPHT